MLGVKLTVRCGKEDREFFDTDTGVPQGNGYCANEFTFYLAQALSDEDQDQRIEIEHNYAKVIPADENDEVDIDMEYADDLTNVNEDDEAQDSNRIEKTEKLASYKLPIKTKIVEKI